MDGVEDIRSGVLLEVESVGSRDNESLGSTCIFSIRDYCIASFRLISSSVMIFMSK